MAEAEVLDLLGAPDSVGPTSEEEVGYTWHSIFYTGFEIEFADGRVAYATCTQSCRGPRGLTVGDPSERVEEILGTPVASQFPDAFAAQYVATSSDCGLNVTYRSGMISEFQLWCDYS